MRPFLYFVVFISPFLSSCIDASKESSKPDFRTSLTGAIDAEMMPRTQLSLFDMSPTERDQLVGETALENVCGASDIDLDGYGADLACADPDCDDQNELINPGATETCNGLDDDCDGAIDELTEPTVCGQGACVSTQDCVDGRLTECVPGDPMPEVCNGIDDDCDGIIDNALNIEIVPVQFGVLTALVGGCNELSKLPSVACRSAVHQFCQNRGCSTSGFGPVSTAGQELSVVCLNETVSLETPFGALSEETDRQCEGQGELNQSGCVSAFHHFCRNRGFGSGFGPIASTGQAVTMVCIESDLVTTFQLSYASVQASHPNCRFFNRRAGRDVESCNVAFHAACVTQGHQTGFGPVEVNSANAVYRLSCLNDDMP